MEGKKKGSNYCEHYSPTFTKQRPLATDCLYRADDGTNAAFCKRPDMYRCVMEVPVFPVPLSHSAVGNFICPYLYYLKDIRGINVVESHTSDAIKAGQLWDSGKQKLLGRDIDLSTIIDKYEIPDMVVAKVKALYRAYKTLDIKVEPGYQLQAPFYHELKIEGACIGYDKLYVRGFYDRKYEKCFHEDKLSSKPDNYLDPFFIQSQVGTYFMADPGLEYCVMEVVRTPDLRSAGKFKEESAESYEERCYQDIIARPSFYFIGWDREKKMYGKKYYRSEFDLEEISQKYRMVSVHINDCAVFDGWYKNSKLCGNMLPGIPCDMRPICRYNTLSETMYTIKEKKGAKE